MRLTFISIIIVYLAFSTFLLSEEHNILEIFINDVQNEDIENITLDILIDTIKDIPVIYIGENHDKKSHHEIQLNIIENLYKNNPNITIGMEMFQSRFQKYLNQFIFSNLNEEDLINKTEYEKRWGYDYKLYKPILDFAKANKVPIVALNIESEVIRKISRSGISGLNAKYLNKLPKHIDFTNKDYKKYLFEIFKQHPGSKNRAFDKFYSIQLVWDEFMSEQIVRYIKSSPENQHILLAGNGHLIYSYGIPSRVYKRINGQYSVILNDVDIKPQIADYVINALNE